MRWIAPILLLFAVACATTAPPPAPPPQPLGVLAERYVRLTLEIDKLEDGYVDAYYGPAEWREQAEAQPPLAAAVLVRRADALTRDIEIASPLITEPLATQRVRYLLASVASARLRLRMIDGLEIGFADEAQGLFALRPVLQPLASFDPIIARIDALLPGEAPLADRFAALQARNAIPAEYLEPVLRAAIAECRRRTAEYLPLPEGEAFRMELVTGEPWGAYNWYQGGNVSLIQISADQNVTPPRALTLGCHEGYPGHHVQGIYAERSYRQLNWIEFSVLPLYNPVAPLYEGAGNYGVELAFPPEERLAYLRDVLYPLAGLDPNMAAEFDAVSQLFGQLAGAQRTIAAMYIDGEIDRAQAIELLQRYRVATPEAAEQSLRFIDRYRSYIINYSSGEDVVRAFVEAAGDDPAARWAAFERIMAEPLLPQDLAR